MSIPPKESSVAPKKLTILGSTGSIGKSALAVVDSHPGRFDIIALAAGKNIELLCEQVIRYRPRFVVVQSPTEERLLLGKGLPHEFEVRSGQDGLKEAASLPDNDIVLNGLVGAAGLLASLETVKAGKYLALANKESLVVGGPLFKGEMEKSGAKILPVDSEHSAIWQCLSSGKLGEVRRILLTGSGGPFRDRPAETFSEITPEEALAHPTWKMGPKITIDSATMMNKGLELIEAVWLFSIPAEQVKIVIHPQSIVHSMVEYVDSSIVAQMSMPDMKLPILYALFWPERVESVDGRLDLADVGRLEFYPPDEEKFPALRLCREAAMLGGTAPAVVNAANEVAVAHFLKGNIRFPRITELIEAIIVKHRVKIDPSLDDILDCDRTTRAEVEKLIGNTI
jgi:1-deoxy-D-xylulose-5-phosphate reductoisomerase